MGDLGAITLLLFHKGGFDFPISDPHTARAAVRWLKTYHGVTQTRIANAIDDHQSSVSCWLNKREPRIPTQLRIIQFLNRRYQERRLEQQRSDDEVVGRTRVGLRSSVNAAKHEHDPAAASEQEDATTDLRESLEQLTLRTPRNKTRNDAAASTAKEEEKDADTQEILEEYKVIPGRNGSGYVYIMYDRDRRFKVGSSEDPMRRCRQLRTGNIDIAVRSSYPVKNFRLNAGKACHLELRRNRLIKHIDLQWYETDWEAISDIVERVCSQFQ